MNFKYYDLLSHIVPGYIIYLVLILTFANLPEIDILPSIAIAFILGYVINAISSWIENFLYWTWGGKPSDKLLKGEGTFKVKFYEFDKTYKKLKEESGEENPQTDKLFDIALRYIDFSKNEKVSDLNASYAFSRVLLTCLLIVSIIIFYKFYNNWLSYIIMIPLIIIVWARAKDRGYYFVKEVLNMYINIKGN